MNNFSERSSERKPLIKGNWKCSECGKEINELPFEPIEGRPLFCRDCYKMRKPKTY